MTVGSMSLAGLLTPVCSDRPTPHSGSSLWVLWAMWGALRTTAGKTSITFESFVHVSAVIPVRAGWIWDGGVSGMIFVAT